jgi:hypothetical protein
MLATACKVNISYVEMKIVSKHLMMKPTKLHEKKAPKKRREKKQGVRTKVQQANSPFKREGNH